MKKTNCALIAIALLSAGCAPDRSASNEQATTEQQTPSSQPVSGPAPVEAHAPEAALAFDPGAFSFPFEWSQRYNRLGVTKMSKRQQRQVLLEVKQKPVDEIVRGIGDAMAKAGFEAKAPKQEYGGVRLGFTRSRERPVSMLVRPKGQGPTLRDPEATASLYITRIARPAAIEE